jgi:quinoprotein dehydrogenase-associated probable ABC transporter substrate-binding protein
MLRRSLEIKMSGNSAFHIARSIGLAATTLGFAALVMAIARAEDSQTSLNSFRVCADPNNLPFSDQAQEGFENKLADLIAADFGEKVTYTWHAQRRAFVHETLKAKKCDVIMGLPIQLDMVDVTQPYYRSAYVFVSRADRHIDIQSIKDSQLRTLKIGVQLIGDDGFNTPPSHALAAQGINRNLVGYPVYGDYGEPSPSARIVTAVEHGDIDIAAVWGPLAGYFAKNSAVPLAVVPITETASFAPLIFQYDIGLGVRRGDRARRAKLDDFIVRKQPQIAALLADYGVPTLAIPSESSQAVGGGHASR